MHKTELSIKKGNAGDEVLDIKNGTRLDSRIKPKLIDYIWERLF